MKKWAENMEGLGATIVEHWDYVLSFLGIVVGVFMVAYLIEKMIQRKRGEHGTILNTRKIAMIGMFSALAGILMLFEIPLPFLAPSFYELDFSELPVLICGFAFGPVAGVVTEFLKIMIKMLFKSTSTALVGELANFVIGCTLILPATTIYHIRKRKTNAVIGCIAGTICMTVFGTAFNALYLLPAFSVMFFGGNLDIILGMGSAIHEGIGDSIVRFVIYCVAPINLIKGTAVSVITMLIYKPLSPILHTSHAERRGRKSK